MAGLYTRFDGIKLILRDELAIDRTLLANERTLMAYLRAGVALVLAGITFVHFAESTWFELFGMACVPIGAAVSLFGAVRFRRMQQDLGGIHRGLESAPPAKACPPDESV